MDAIRRAGTTSESYVAHQRHPPRPLFRTEPDPTQT